MRKLLAILAIMMASAVQAQTPVPIRAQSALVIDAATNEVLLQQNHDDVKSIASITKLMTAFVVVGSALPMDEVIEINQEDVDGTRLRGHPTSGSIAPGMKFSRAELLHLALMNSQNRAAYALARTYPGGLSMFIAIMNATALELGMTHTTYVDPTGLMAGNVSTVGDLALLVQAAGKSAAIRDFSTSTSLKTTQKMRKKDRVLGFGTTNNLLANAKWDIQLQKTGYIQHAGRCIVMLASIATRNVIIVLLDAADPRQRTADATAIKTWLERQHS